MEYDGRTVAVARMSALLLLIVLSGCVEQKAPVASFNITNQTNSTDEVLSTGPVAGAKGFFQKIKDFTLVGSLFNLIDTAVKSVLGSNGWWLILGVGLILIVVKNFGWIGMVFGFVLLAYAFKTIL